jgi:hypothetical protein
VPSDSGCAVVARLDLVAEAFVKVGTAGGGVAETIPRQLSKHDFSIMLRTWRFEMTLT